MYKKGLILVLIGLLIMMSIATIIGLNPEKFSINNGNNYSEENISIGTDGIDSLELYGKNDGFKIIPTDSNEVSIKYNKTDDREYVYEKIGNKIVIKNKYNDIYKIKFFSFDFNFNKMAEIRIPRDIIKNIKAENKNAVISIADFNLENVELKTTNAVIEVKDINCKGNISTKTTNSLINMENIRCDNELKISTTNAMVNINNVIANEKLLVDSSNGALNFDRIDSKSIDMHTTNAMVNIELIGSKTDYNRDIRTTNAIIKIEDSKYGKEVQENFDGATKNLKIKTTNGGVKLEFYK